jgi:hypothetical protein
MMFVDIYCSCVANDASKKCGRSLTEKEKSAEARSRGHEDKTWTDTGRTYSPDEAKIRQKKYE